MMRVIIAGGTGAIGSSLVDVLLEGDYQLVVLSRDPDRAAQRFRGKNVQAIGWDARTDSGWGSLITSETVIVNLAGENPAHWRWTAAHKCRVRDSRIGTTQAIMQAIAHYEPPAVSGPINVSAPRPATNRDFIRTLGSIVGRPSLIPIPAVTLKLVLGEMAAVVLDSQRMIPDRLLTGGFTFQFPDLGAALRD